MAHAIKALLSYYDAAFHAKFGQAAPIVGAKDAALAKRLLARYPDAALRGWIDRFFASTDPFIQQSGYTFGVFSSCLGKVIVEAKADAQVRVSPRMARSLKAIYSDDD